MLAIHPHITPFAGICGAVLGPPSVCLTPHIDIFCNPLQPSSPSPLPPPPCHLMPHSRLMFTAAVRRWEKGVLQGGKKSPEAIHSLVETNNPSGKRRKESTMPFGINSLRSQVLYRAAQESRVIEVVLACPIVPPIASS